MLTGLIDSTGAVVSTCSSIGGSRTGSSSAGTEATGSTSEFSVPVPGYAGAIF